MLTKQDFLDKAYANIDNYPQVAMLYRLGDPRITQHIEAIATMLAMQSQQQEAAVMEAFSKERDSTILADAAMRGIIPRASGVRVRLLIENTSDTSITLAQGRQITDSDGNIYQLETPVTVESGSASEFIAVQGYTTRITHTISDSIPFYPIEVPTASDGSFLASITVEDAKGALDWSLNYTNVQPNDRIFHVEVDDQQRVYVRFGYSGVVGIQPENGTRLTLTVGYAMGDVVPKAGSPFSLDYTNAAEASASISMLEVLLRGKDPIGTDTLRDFARYPSIYNDSAVFLGEFSYLVRKTHPDLGFVNVWNEQQEEMARGASVDNINALFVAMSSTPGAETILTQSAGEFVVGQRVPDGNLSPAQLTVKKTLINADDSYRIYFVTPVQAFIGVTLNAKIAPSYVAGDVASQIKAVILESYGARSKPARRGYNKPLHQRIYALLREKVPALSNAESDWTVSIDMPQDWQTRPEMWVYVDSSTLNVTVETVNIIQPTWGM